MRLILLENCKETPKTMSSIVKDQKIKTILILN